MSYISIPAGRAAAVTVLAASLVIGRPRQGLVVYDPPALTSSPLTSLSVSSTIAFAALTLSLLAQWVPSAGRRRTAWLIGWLVPLAVSLVAASWAGLTSRAGLSVLAALALACALAARHPGRVVRAAAQLVMVAISAGLLLHVMPGFENPRVLHDVVLTPGAQPYTKYLNFDKAAAGLLLLGVSAPQLTQRDEGVRHAAGFAWRFVVMIAVVMTLSVAFGYVRWDPKLPSWWPLWLWSMVFFTALPEEVVFRGLLQTWVTEWLGPTRAVWPSVAVVGTVFGLAHVAGGPSYVVLATAAGIGYGWIFVSTRSIGAAIAAHAGLNTVHFLLFTYPAVSLL